MATLLLGSGTSRQKRVVHELTPDREFSDLVTLDLENADIIHNLDFTDLPFRDESFDEIHAYEVLEHCGTQGDVEYFFDQFNDFHRILKPGGVLCGSVPNYQGVWAFGDPGHRRVLPPTVFNYLCEEFYEQLGKTPCADYRSLIKGYWKLIGIQEGEVTFFLLQK